MYVQLHFTLKGKGPERVHLEPPWETKTQSEVMEKMMGKCWEKEEQLESQVLGGSLDVSVRSVTAQL